MIEILGILIGFCSIMLMFSMLVTAIVQGISSAINLRAWNLDGGLQSLANKIISLDKNGSLNGKLKEKLLHLTEANFGFLKRKVGFVSYEQVISSISELYSENIKGNIKFTIKSDLEEKIKAHFERIEDEMVARFQTWMNGLSIIVALAVVLMFQLNTFELLKKLSLNEDYRNSLIAYAEKAEAPPMLIDSKEVFLKVNDKVNSSYIAQYGKEQPSLEQLSALGNEDLDDAMTEFSAALDDSPEFLQAHYDEYKEQLQRAMKIELKKAQTDISSSMNELAEFDFEPLPNGWEYFYFENKNWFKNWVGLLISTILISLGAPFWFSTVRNLIGLRDSLSSRRAPKNDSSVDSSPKSKTIKPQGSS
jgi:hypothetical protein